MLDSGGILIEVKYHFHVLQSSWTKQAVEDQVDSPRLLSNLNEVPECPDSTCAQFTFPNATPSESKLLSITATKECDEQKEPPGIQHSIQTSSFYALP